MVNYHLVSADQQVVGWSASDNTQTGISGADLLRYHRAHFMLSYHITLTSGEWGACPVLSVALILVY